MSARPSVRNLKSIRLTAHLHWHYMGLGFILSLIFIVAISFTMGTLVLIQADLFNLLDEGLAVKIGAMHRHLVLLAGLQIVFYLIGLIALSILTAHRIAGPYLALKRTFAQIHDGDLNARLHFRKYDNLDDVAVSFNTMMDTLKSRTAHLNPIDSASANEESNDEVI